MLNMLQCCKSLAFRPKAFFRVILTCRIFFYPMNYRAKFFGLPGLGFSMIFWVVFSFYGLCFLLQVESRTQIRIL